ncbi:MAG: hypothetical protein ACMUIP_06310 [bacterium]
MNRSLFLKLVLFMTLLILSVACSNGNNKAMSLQFFEKIYVPVNPSSFLSLDKILAAKGIGNVTSGDLNLTYTYMDSSFEDQSAPALILYSDYRFIPSGEAYTALRVREFYEIAARDENAAGIVVNPDVSGTQSYTITKAEIQEAIPKIKKREPLPKDISIVQ